MCWISCTPRHAGICRVGVKWVRDRVKAACRVDRRVGVEVFRQELSITVPPLSAQFIPPLPSLDVKEVTDRSIMARQ